MRRTHYPNQAGLLAVLIVGPGPVGRAGLLPGPALGSDWLRRGVRW